MSSPSNSEAPFPISSNSATGVLLNSPMPYIKSPNQEVLFPIPPNAEFFPIIASVDIESLGETNTSFIVRPNLATSISPNIGSQDSNILNIPNRPNMKEKNTGLELEEVQKTNPSVENTAQRVIVSHKTLKINYDNIGNEAPRRVGIFKQVRPRPLELKSEPETHMPILCPEVSIPILRLESQLAAELKQPGSSKQFPIKENFKRLGKPKPRADTQYECQFCAKVLASKQTYAWHLRTHTGERPYRCKYCPKAYLSQPALFMHNKFVKCLINNNTNGNLQSSNSSHQNSDGPTPRPSSLIVDQNQNDATTDDDNDDEYTPGAKLVTCRSTRKLGQYAITRRKTGKTKKKYRRRQGQSKKLECQHCARIFVYPKTLDKHIQRHHNSTDHAKKPDDELGFGADTKKSYTEPTFTLPADPAISKPSHALAHKNKIQPVDSLECPYCHKLLSKRATLIDHIRLHTGEKPYQCNNCLARFHSFVYLSLHSRNCKKMTTAQINRKLKAVKSADVPVKNQSIPISPENSSISEEQQQPSTSVAFAGDNSQEKYFRTRPFHNGPKYAAAATGDEKTDEEDYITPRLPVSTSQIQTQTVNSNVVTVVVTAPASADMRMVSSTNTTATAHVHIPEPSKSASANTSAPTQSTHKCNHCNAFFDSPLVLLKHILRECNAAHRNKN